MSRKLSKEEQGAIYLIRACNNGDNLSDRMRAIVLLFGSEFKIETERGKYTLLKFFGKLYYI